MAEEEPELASIDIKHPTLDGAEDALHPGLLRVFAAIAEQARGHQRRERERHDAAGENRDDDGDRELAEDAPHQSAHEDERDEDGGQR